MITLDPRSALVPVYDFFCLLVFQGIIELALIIDATLISHFDLLLVWANLSQAYIFRTMLLLKPDLKTVWA